VSSFAERYGPWALVTGASRGLGAAFADALAACGLNLVLVATTAEGLAPVAARLERTHGVRTRAVPLDLARPDFLAPLDQATAEVPIGLLVSNAGLSRVGRFLDQEPDQLVRQLHVNARATLVLARHFAAPMAARGRGGIILVSSGSALHGTALSANYAATKAYNLILAESLWYELAPRGVDVLGFLAGATRTPGWAANRPRPSRLVPVMDPAPAVRQALRALGRTPSFAAGRANRAGYALLGLLPRATAVRLLARQMTTMFGPGA
jgi:short-subunit dehydrogenase